MWSMCRETFIVNKGYVKPLATEHYLDPDDTYKDYAAPKSYEDWEGEDERVIERTSYLRPKVPFYGETTNRSQYTWKDPVFNKPRLATSYGSLLSCVLKFSVG